MKKIIFLVIATLFLNGCFQIVALVVPAASGVATGNLYQSAISYSLSYGVKKATGKTIIENVIDMSEDEQKITKIKKNEELIHSLHSFYPNAFYYPDAFPKL